MENDSQIDQIDFALDARGLYKSFGSVHAVNGVDLQVKPGEIVALLGPNGAGKSTSLDLALGLIPADKGSSQIFGHKPAQAIKRCLVGQVQQNDALLNEYRVNQLLKMVASTMAQPRPITEVMEWCGLVDIAGRKVKKCSGGEKQRIRLALGLLGDPVLLILDEPTNGMDVENRQHFWQFITEQSERGRAIIFATHYLAEAEKYAQRTIIINRGRVLADETTTKLRERVSSTLRIGYEGKQEDAQRALEPFLTKSGAKLSFESSHLIVQGNRLDQAARIVLDLPGASGLEIIHSTLEDAYSCLLADDNEAIADPDSTVVLPIPDSSQE